MTTLMDGISFLIKGGPMMWPLLACAMLSIAVMIERFIAITKAGSINTAILNQVRTLLTQQRMSDALRACESATGPVASLVAHGIRNQDLGADANERSMEELALRQSSTLTKRLGVLDTIITVAPLLGLLGTVTGMIRAFNVVSSASGLNAPAGITGGVAEALIATATGLAVAIVTLVGYNYLTERVKEIIAEMEIRATELLNILAGPKDAGENAVLAGKETGSGEAAGARG